MDNQTIQVIVMYSDKNMWLIPAYLRAWEKYANHIPYQFHLVFCGYTPIAENLRWLGVDNYIIGRQEDYPANRWSDSFLQVLDNVAEKTFIFMLEDYILIRDVDNLGVKHLYDYVKDRDYVLKADLTHDRLWSGGGTRYLWGFNTYGHCGHLDLIRSYVGTDYQMSLWGGIFNRDTMRQFVVPGETAQQLELNGTHRVNSVGDSVLVIGTRQSPFKHANIIQAGGLNQHETVGLPALDEEDRDYILHLLKGQTR